MNQGNTGVRHDGQVDSRNDSGIFNVTAYNGFGKPGSQAVYVNVAFEYMINTLKKFLLWCFSRFTVDGNGDIRKERTQHTNLI